MLVHVYILHFLLLYALSSWENLALVCVGGRAGGRQALKLGLHRKFSDHLALVKEAMKIFLRSSVLLMVLVRQDTWKDDPDQSHLKI